MATRRDFIKGLGGALGAVVLTSSCGSGGGTAGSPPVPIPNGYRFFRIISSGDSLPGGNTLAAIPGVAMLNDRSEVYFYGSDQTEANGFYELLMDFSGSRPTLLQQRRVVREGDRLRDSKTVSQIQMADVNNRGSFAAILHTDDNLSGLYLEREKQGFEPIAGYLTKLPDGKGRFGAIFGDVDIHTNDDILMVAHFAPHDSVQGQQGLFHLPGGEVSQKGRIVASTTDLIPEAGGFLTGMGLVDLHDDGNFVLQAYGTSSENIFRKQLEKGGALNGRAGSMLINGSVKDPFSKVLGSASSSLKVRKTAAARTGFSVGELKYGPRIGGKNNAAFITHVNETHLVLYYNSRQVVSTGARSPLGEVITSFSAPVVGSDGLLYYQVVTDKGLELIVYNGKDSKTILSKDDTVDGSVLRSFFFGLMTEQVDSSGRVVLTGDFEDGRSSLIVGIPI